MESKKDSGTKSRVGNSLVVSIPNNSIYPPIMCSIPESKLLGMDELENPALLRKIAKQGIFDATIAKQGIGNFSVAKQGISKYRRFFWEINLKQPKYSIFRNLVKFFMGKIIELYFQKRRTIDTSQLIDRVITHPRISIRVSPSFRTSLNQFRLGHLGWGS